MNERKKVLHILWSGGIGGTEEYITSLIRYFDTSKFEIYLCFLSEKGTIFEEAVKVTRNISFIGMRTGFDMIGAFKIYKMLKRGQFDIIHMHSANILTNLVISLFRKPRKIFSEHMSPGAEDVFKKRKLFYRIFPKMFQIVIAISETVKKKLTQSLGVNAHRIMVVHNGISMEKYSASLFPPQDLIYLKENDRVIFGFVGRMVDFKRPLLFVEFASEIIKRNKNCHFIIVGDGPELEKCKNMIHHLGIIDYFSILGFRRDIPNIMKLLDVVIFTSKGEGFGIVLIEAMAMGIPVFAVNDGAVTEIIRDGENGILMDTVDPQRAACQILEVVTNMDLMDRIKKNCVTDVKSRFSIEESARQMENIYTEVLSRV